jgi:hypothetical protein
MLSIDAPGLPIYAIQSGNCQSRWQSMAKYQILGLQITCPALFVVPVSATRARYDRPWPIHCGLRHHDVVRHRSTVAASDRIPQSSRVIVTCDSTAPSLLVAA